MKKFKATEYFRMGAFLNTVFLDNPIKSYLIVACSLSLIFLFKRLLSRYLAGVLFAVVKRMVRGVDKPSFIKLVVSPLEVFMLVLLSLIAFNKLNFPTLLNVDIYKFSVRQFIDSIATIVLIIVFIWLLLRIMDFVAMILHHRADQTADATDNQLVVFFKDFFKVVLVIFGILLILKFAFHYNISNLLTGLSIATAAIALSTRESLENLIASFIIFFDRPFTMGDQVKVHDITGTVERIGLRSTRIRTDQKTYVSVPNKQMVDSILDNLSLRTQRRAFVQLKLHADTSHDAVNQFILRVKNYLTQRKDKVENHTVFLADIVENAYIINVEFFAAPIPVADFNELRQQVNLSLINLMGEMNIKLATREEGSRLEPKQVV
ncbi:MULTISPECIES: mechanosensitive ion channel family protein [Niastella]|uniref:Mechanosensitive ion channel n=1 Tax=Niastella soli TaxID=2821487 RepID=A0ABS3YP12_9BACT|nr:mechanosensitive ion channel domain-containing protein [Niastella soli]MBO9199210.1 mechanosensitive ion channel [Niastella soli]